MTKPQWFILGVALGALSCDLPTSTRANVLEGVLELKNGNYGEVLYRCERAEIDLETMRLTCRDY